MRKETAIASGLALVLLATSATAAPRYSQVGTVNGQPEVKDAKTNLIWQGCPMGQSGNDCATGGTSNYKWHDALSACSNLSWGAGTNAWRLPNIKELQTIVNDLTSYPAIDATNFPATPSNYFWSSSSYPTSIGNAWVVYFGDGLVDANFKGFNGFDVRCVRSGT